MDDGKQDRALRKDVDAPDPLSPNYAIDAVPTIDLPPVASSPSVPSPNSDIAVAGRSLQTSDTRRSGDHPLEPSHRQYDIV